jgi:hypothetical protein
VVAVAGGKVVGAKSGMAFHVARGGVTMLAIQPCDTMVAADHRRRGLYSRMTEYMKEVHRDGEASMFFNFPNEVTLAGSLKHGWVTVGIVPIHYRIQNPAAFVFDSGTRLPVLPRAMRAITDRNRRLRERSLGTSGAVRVEGHPSIPVETLAGLYARAVPDRYHVVRDETFYGWRFGNPNWRYTAYTASVDGVAEAAIVVGRRRVPDGQDNALLTDALPLALARAAPEVYDALLARIVADHHDADAIAASGETLPGEVRKRFGFHSNGSFPLSQVTSATTLVAYSLSETVGSDLYDQSNWTVQFSDMDTR